MEKYDASGWEAALRKLQFLFGGQVDLTAAVFLIGLREFGEIKRQLNKNEKMDVMHIGVCTLLSRYGYYRYAGRDMDGWPHFERLTRLPPLDSNLQEKLLKEAVSEYLKEL